MSNNSNLEIDGLKVTFSFHVIEKNHPLSPFRIRAAHKLNSPPQNYSGHDSNWMENFTHCIAAFLFHMMVPWTPNTKSDISILLSGTTVPKKRTYIYMFFSPKFPDKSSDIIKISDTISIHKILIPPLTQKKNQHVLNQHFIFI